MRLFHAEWWLFICKKENDEYFIYDLITFIFYQLAAA